MSKAVFLTPWCARKSPHEVKRKGAEELKRADFRTFYREAHAVDCLSEREKMLMGLAVAMTRNCEP